MLINKNTLKSLSIFNHKQSVISFMKQLWNCVCLFLQNTKAVDAIGKCLCSLNSKQRIDEILRLQILKF